MKNIADYKNRISSLILFVDKRRQKIQELITSVKPLSLELDRIREKYKIERDFGFNFFTSISDKYYMENFHSDILKQILDPKTDTLGKEQFIRTFIAVLNKLRPEVISEKTFSDNITSVKVEREEGLIDLLIYDENNAIIIENKINNAVDQENQLARYVEYVKNKGRKLLAIVYLPLSPEKKPPLYFTKGYEIYNDKVKEKMIILPAINRRPQIDYAHGFLDKCAELSTENIVKVYMSQYSQLVKYLGGRYVMNETSKKVIEEIIYSDQESRNIVKDLVEIWDNHELLMELIQDKIKGENGYFNHDDDNNTIYKIINEDISIGLQRDKSYGECFFCMGFVCSPGKTNIPEKLKDQLRMILGNKEFALCFSEQKEDTEWVWKELKVNQISQIQGSLGDIVKFIVEKLNFLEEKFRLTI